MLLICQVGIREPSRSVVWGVHDKWEYAHHSDVHFGKIMGGAWDIGMVGTWWSDQVLKPKGTLNNDLLSRALLTLRIGEAVLQ